MPIFTFVPGDRSPPPAPKHATAASSKPRVPRQPAQPRKVPAPPVYYQQHQDYDQMDVHEETPDNDTVASESQFGDYQDMSHYTNPRSSKRRRVEDQISQADREHQLWAEELLDYFVLQDSSMDAAPSAPAPPVNVNFNRPIDDRGHTALHWAAAMGDIEVVKDLIRRGASIDCQSHNGETPLMRAVIFTNCFDKRNMEKLAGLLIRTVNMQEWSGSTVFHHIAGITQSKKKYDCARYYMDCVLNTMTERMSPDSVERILNEIDQNGDTAITIAARHGARKCVRSLIGRNAAVDIPNNVGETADQLIVQLNHRRQERNRQLSSSPFQDGGHATSGGAVQLPNGSLPFEILPFSGLNNTSSQLNGTFGSQEIYKSEAALTLTSSVLPSFAAKTKALASSLDAEIAEKDAELAEAERVAALRRGELEAMRRQAEELRVREMEQTSGGIETDEQLVRELEELSQECEGLVAEEEIAGLSELLKAEESKLASPPNSDPTDDDTEMDGGASREKILRKKLEMARHVARLNEERKELVKTLVTNISLAGYGGSADRQKQYKRLITGALNVREEDVEGMLPEIVAELEEWRGMEAVSA